MAISSWESLSPTLAPADWGLHNAAMAQRNYPIDNFVVVTANTLWPSGFDNITGELFLKKNLYFAMLGQALFVKSAIEGRKSGNSFGVRPLAVARRAPASCALTLLLPSTATRCAHAWARAEHYLAV